MFLGNTRIFLSVYLINLFNFIAEFIIYVSLFYSHIYNLYIIDGILYNIHVYITIKS